jgi:oligoendopeptidase F
MRDVLTLAHELGHTIHQVLANKKGMIFSRQPLTFAETASIFGEQLTFRYLLSKIQDKKQRNLLIASKIEDMLNTSVRQIAICEFERQVHEARKKNMLSAEEIGKIWLATQSESLGQAVNLSGDYKYFWAYIPHIVHSPFYVYAYAFGECLVNSLYEVYMNNSADFTNKYITLLENSGVMLHQELLSRFRLSAYEKGFWQKGLYMINNLIDEIA